MWKTATAEAAAHLDNSCIIEVNVDLESRRVRATLLGLYFVSSACRDLGSMSRRTMATSGPLRGSRFAMQLNSRRGTWFPRRHTPANAADAALVLIHDMAHPV